ncbi:MAG: hypothetical protein K0S26_804 [Bacteroidota bacterium]|jgi:hypothetical protein|nr:hypothetical protein [Bacteroidota bacterium]
MKSISVLIIILLPFVISSFSKLPNELPVLHSSSDSVPILNQQVLSFVKSKIGKKVDRGECWDFAAEALRNVNAKWDNHYKFGREIDFKNEPVFPGDIVQFEGVTLNYEMKGMKYTEKMLHHTAIIYEVFGREEYSIAHQNNGFSGKKVGISPLKLASITKGKIKIFRPEQ